MFLSITCIVQNPEYPLFGASSITCIFFLYPGKSLWYFLIMYRNAAIYVTRDGWLKWCESMTYYKALLDSPEGVPSCNTIVIWACRGYVKPINTKWAVSWMKHPVDLIKSCIAQPQGGGIILYEMARDACRKVSFWPLTGTKRGMFTSPTSEPLAVLFQH